MRYLFFVNIPGAEDNWKLFDHNITFLEEEAQAFHEMYAAMGWEQNDI